MNLEKFIQNIKESNISIIDSEALLETIDLEQNDIQKILQFSLLDDKYITITKLIWPLVEDDKGGIVKYNLYCHLLKNKTFNEKTARYICLKNRDLKILRTSLLAECGTIKAVNFLLNAYTLNISNIAESISSCYYEAQIPIMEHLLSKLNELQKNKALNSFITAYIDNYPKDLGLVQFVLKQKEIWADEVLNDERIKKIIFFNSIEKKLVKTNNKIKSSKI